MLRHSNALRRSPCLGVFLGLLVLGAVLPSRLLAQTNACRIQIVVTGQNDQDKVRDVTVELMDAVGGNSVADKKVTDSDGRVVFSSFTGTHRVRASGSEIELYDGEFEVSPAETFHVEMIRVRRKPAVGENKAAAGEGTVPSVRLNISGKARKQYERANKAMEQKKWDEARTLFQSAVAAAGDFDLAYNGLGVADTNLDDFAGAEAAFRKAILINPKYAAAQRNLARILLMEKKYEETALLLRQSLVVEPTNTWAMTNAAYALFQLKRYEEAAALARRVHQFPHAESAEAHMIAGLALEALGQAADAVSEFQLYLKEEPAGANASQARESIARLSAPAQ